MNDILNFLAKGAQALAALAKDGQTTPLQAEPKDVRKNIILERLQAEVTKVIAGDRETSWIRLGPITDPAACAAALYELLVSKKIDPATAVKASSSVVKSEIAVDANAFKKLGETEWYGASLDGFPTLKALTKSPTNGWAEIKKLKGDYSLWAPSEQTGKYEGNFVYCQIIGGGELLKASFTPISAE